MLGLCVWTETCEIQTVITLRKKDYNERKSVFCGNGKKRARWEKKKRSAVDIYEGHSMMTMG